MDIKNTVGHKDKKKKLTYVEIKKQQELAKTKREKEKYFEYYDDVKSHTHKIIDW